MKSARLRLRLGVAALALVLSVTVTARAADPASAFADPAAFGSSGQLLAGSAAAYVALGGTAAALAPFAVGALLVTGLYLLYPTPGVAQRTYGEICAARIGTSYGNFPHVSKNQPILYVPDPRVNQEPRNAPAGLVACRPSVEIADLYTATQIATSPFQRDVCAAMWAESAVAEAARTWAVSIHGSTAYIDSACPAAWRPFFLGQGPAPADVGGVTQGVYVDQGVYALYQADAVTISPTEPGRMWPAVGTHEPDGSQGTWLSGNSGCNSPACIPSRTGPTLDAFTGHASFVFTGGQAFITPGSNKLNTSQWSWAEWVKLDPSRYGAGVTWLYSQQYEGPAGSANLMQAYVASSGQVCAALNNGGPTVCSGAGHVLTDGKAHHVAITQGGNEARLYFDGVIAGTVGSTDFTPNQGWVSWGGNRATLADYFVGAADMMATWQRAITATEVGQLAVAVAAGACPSGSVLATTGVDAGHCTPVYAPPAPTANPATQGTTVVTPEAAPGDGGVLDALSHLGNRVVSGLTSLGDITRYVADTVWAGSQAVVAALSPQLARVGDLLANAVGLLADMATTLQDLADTITTKISAELQRLFVPTDANLRSYRARASTAVTGSAFGATAVTATAAVGSLAALWSTSGSPCGPTVGFDEITVTGQATMPGFHVALPSPSPCPGNGAGGGRTSWDNDAADLYGYRSLVRNLISFAVVFTAVWSLIDTAPWSDRSRMAAPA